MPITSDRGDMTQTLTRPTRAAAEPEPFLIKFKPLTYMDDEQFAKFCALNDDLRIERTAKGEIVLMPPTFSYSGNRNFHLAIQVGNWATADGTGEGFDSSTGFRLPNGALRSPDIAWILQERLEELPSEERRKFPPICPDFVIELRSSSDSLSMLQAKMQEYMNNGARLGWLIDPVSTPKRVHIYRPNADVIILDEPGRSFRRPGTARLHAELEPHLGAALLASIDAFAAT